MLDLYDVTDLLESEERQVRSVARRFVDTDLIPHVSAWWEEGDYPRELARTFGELGFLGANLPEEYGGAGLSNVGYGLVMYELDRAGRGLANFGSNQGALALLPIHVDGSGAQ